MNALHGILAESDESNLPKVIFGVIFFAIWAISAIASAIAKKKEQERRRQVRESIERGPAPPPLPEPTPQRRVPRQPPPRPAPATRAPVQPKRFPVKSPRPVARRAAPSLASSSTSEVEPSSAARAPVAATEISAQPVAPSRRSTGVTAGALHLWLKPSTLRQQFILTEVFQPPLALRESHL